MSKARDGTHLWLVLMKAHRALAQHAERSIVSLDMCLSDFAVLEVLLHKGPLKVAEIGKRIALTSGAMTTAIDRLEARGLVARTAEVGDRRTRIISLTHDGEVLITDVFADHAAAMAQATSALTKTEAATLTELLKKLGTDAEAQLAPPHTTPKPGART